MAIDISQYDYAVVTACEDILRAELSALIATVNTELAGQIVIDTPENAQLAARSDSKLDERAFPQAIRGVWCRVVDTRDILGVGGLSSAGGQARTLHRLEVSSYATVQVQESGSLTPTTQTTGYKTIALLSRVATFAIQGNRTTMCAAGVYNVLRVGGNRIPSPVKGLPHVHQIKDYFDVYQTTRR